MISETKKIRLILALRQSGITNTGILAAMERVPRDRFVPEAFRDRAYEDTALPIGHGQTVSQPQIGFEKPAVMPSIVTMSAAVPRL